MKRRRKSQPVAINPLVVDLSHHNDVADFGKVKAAGIAGIIHKATEAIDFVDNTYAVRRGHAVNAGLLWGAYHFLRPVSIPAQVDFFLKIAAPEFGPYTIMCRLVKREQAAEDGTTHMILWEPRS